jgi:chemotaxis protein MotB
LRQRAHRSSNGPSRDRWLLSYADFITLLFAFFTTMYAMSTVDASKLSSVAAGMQSAFDAPVADRRAGPLTASMRGVLPAGRGVVAPYEPPAPDARTEIERVFADDLSSHRLQLSQDRRGLILSIPEAGAFPVGSADMSEAFKDVTTRLSAALQRLPNSVRIEGHTDDVPIQTPRFSSNWELSTARATQVVQFLIQQGTVAPDRLSVAGYAEFHPLDGNASPEGRARNRRVDVVILNPAMSAAEEPSARTVTP